MSEKLMEIEELEKKYMKSIWGIVNSEAFLDDLYKLETYIQENYDYLAGNWDEKNKLKIGVERLIRFHFYTGLGVVDVYPSPISPDMGIEVEDAILCVDAKTIDMVGNPGDDRSIHFQKNQVTFDNQALYQRNMRGVNLPGVRFPPRLEPYHNQKPCLTYFITINYYDDGKSFRLSHLSVVNVPHKVIAEALFDNDLISNYKTYQYVDKVKASKYGAKYQPQRNIANHWVGFSIKGSGSNDAFLDPDLDHPYIQGTKCIWKKVGGDYKILSYGGSARIDKERLKTRIDSKGNKWNGMETKDIERN